MDRDMNRGMDQAFSYPLDTGYLLRKKRALKRELSAQEPLTPIRVAILAGSTTAEVRDMLEIFLLRAGFRPEFYESAYQRVEEEIRFGEGLKAFRPEILYLHTTYRNLRLLPEHGDGREAVGEKLEREFSSYREIWEKALADHGCLIIQNNFDYPRNRSLGNLDSVMPYGASYYINRMNQRFADYAAAEPRLLINDIQYLSAWLGLSVWHDRSLWVNFKYAVSLQAIPYLAQTIANLIKAARGRTGKCLVLDLDHTLWGGVVGEDGADQIRIGRETGEGEAYLEFQRYVQELSLRGILLAAASKNEPGNAHAGLNHPEMLLGPKDFSAIEANWGPKSRSLQAIAGKLNIGLDSLVFVDDNPAERGEVRAELPMVAVPEVGEDVTRFMDALDRGGYFEAAAVSREDKERVRFYEENRKREQARRSFGDYAEFLRSLRMSAEIGPFEPVQYERIAQLSNKTNQFNLTTKRYSLPQIEAIARDPDMLTLSGRLRDIYGDNGLVSAVIGRILGRELHIELWLMSCRVLGRTMETAMFDGLLEQCRAGGIETVYGCYIPTAKNGLVRDHYRSLGFELAEDGADRTVWRLAVRSVEGRMNTMIEREGEA